MSALGIVTAGYQCADRPLGIVTAGYVCDGAIPPPPVVDLPGGGTSKPVPRPTPSPQDQKHEWQRKLAMQEDEDFIAILELILRNRP